MTTPQLDPDREQKIRRNYADTEAGGTVRTLLDEIDRLRTQRRYLLDQFATKDAKSGDADRAVREFLGGEPAARETRRVLTPSEYNAAWHAVEGAAGEEGADPGTVLHAVLDRLGIAWQDAARPGVVVPAAETGR